MDDALSVRGVDRPLRGRDQHDNGRVAAADDERVDRGGNPTVQQRGRRLSKCERRQLPTPNSQPPRRPARTWGMNVAASSAPRHFVGVGSWELGVDVVSHEREWTAFTPERRWPARSGTPRCPDHARHDDESEAGQITTSLTCGGRPRRVITKPLTLSTIGARILENPLAHSLDAGRSGHPHLTTSTPPGHSTSFSLFTERPLSEA